MAAYDLSMNELQTYQGCSPCPVDFDCYWDRQVEEMKLINPQLQLVPSTFQVPNTECFDLFFTGIGGARIHAKLAKPTVITSEIPAVIEFHGYTLNSGDWIEKIGFAASGIVIASMDCRGQGGLSEDNARVKGNTLHGHIIRGLEEESPDKLYYRSVFLDAAQLVHLLMGMPYVDSSCVGAFGGSQGGALAMVCASLMPTLNRIAPMFPFLSDYVRAWSIDPVLRPYQELKEYFRSFDPRHMQHDKIFERLGYIDIQNHAHRIKADVRMYTALMDDQVPPSTQFAAYNKITASKQVLLYPDHGHEMLPGYRDEVVQYMMNMKPASTPS